MIRRMFGIPHDYDERFDEIPGKRYSVQLRNIVMCLNYLDWDFRNK